MREIIFRGQRYDNREWVYGDLNYNQYDEPWIEYYISPNDLRECEKVWPSTVGQYTGKIDMDGTKVFEGDYLKLNYYIGKVIWDKCAFWMVVYDGDGMELHRVLLDEYDIHRWKVFDNIHNNPKLINNGRRR